MNWSLFVDTDSLYIETRRRFGIDARIDYLNLPLNIVRRLQEIKFFKDKIAMVMRHGKEWPTFVGSLERFGYQVVPTDRGMQPITISAQVVEMAEGARGVVIVTANDRISPLVTQILNSGSTVCLATFDEEFSIKKTFENEEMVNILIMDEEWLWRNKPREA